MKKVDKKSSDQIFNECLQSQTYYLIVEEGWYYNWNRYLCNSVEEALQVLGYSSWEEYEKKEAEKYQNNYRREGFWRYSIIKFNLFDFFDEFMTRIEAKVKEEIIHSEAEAISLEAKDVIDYKVKYQVESRLDKIKREVKKVLDKC